MNIESTTYKLDKKSGKPVQCVYFMIRTNIVVYPLCNYGSLVRKEWNLWPVHKAWWR